MHEAGMDHATGMLLSFLAFLYYGIGHGWRMDWLAFTSIDFLFMGLHFVGISWACFCYILPMSVKTLVDSEFILLHVDCRVYVDLRYLKDID